MKTALSIAGSDSCGGAGIQADIKTMLANGVYAMTAVTAITAQNTTGVAAVQPVTPELLGAQIDAVFEDIVPDAVKIGMLATGELIRVTARRLKHYGAKNIVVDPVMVATSGDALITTDAAKTLATTLFPLATLITPNIPEAQALTGRDITRSRQGMLAAAEELHRAYGCAVLIKGGHSGYADRADDVLVDDAGYHWFSRPRIDSPNTHGTGCTLSSAIAANLAKGAPLTTAIAAAKDYLTGALAAGLDLGRGSGPINHGWALHGSADNEPA